MSGNRNAGVIRNILICAIALTLSGCSGCRKKTLSNEDAEKNKDKERIIVVINGTDLTINEVNIYVDEGIPVIQETDDKVLDEKTYNFPISDTWDNYDTFTIELMDVYELHYVGTVTFDSDTGKEIIKITKDNYDERPGDSLFEQKANQIGK